MAKTMPVPVETSSDSAYQWEFASQWSKAWKVIKWSGAALLTLAFLTVIGQGFLFYRLFDDVHPVHPAAGGIVAFAGRAAPRVIPVHARRSEAAPYAVRSG